ncbi:MAG: hypothetical protein HKN19_03450 [Halioglobus sp.]|nr:hypothetical protein [Halioglobus sp.]
MQQRSKLAQSVQAIFLMVTLLLVATACTDTRDNLVILQNLPDWQDEPCADAPAPSRYDTLMARWNAQTNANPYEPGRTVFTGSSSIRFWERLQEDIAPWAPIQRGFGGAILWEVAGYIDETVIRHDPAAVVIFAGTNDIAVGLAVDDVVTAYRCVVERIAQGLGDDVSIHYIAITPAPSRWEIWPQSSEANARIRSIAAQWPGLHFIDTTPAFLATGEPPDASLFLADALHLTESGYAIWRDAVFPHLEATVDRYAASFDALAPGTRILVDFGPTEDGIGGPTDSPDLQGQHWNSWPAIAANRIMNSGEHLGLLVDTTGQPTFLRLVLAGSSHFARGVPDGGLLQPDPELLGALAAEQATQDYFYTIESGTVVASRGALTFERLATAATYTLRLFASRADAAPASTRYTVTGGGVAQSAALQVSGAGISADGEGDGNDDEVLVFSGLRPDSTGRLHLDFSPATTESGGIAVLSALELIVE